MSEHELERPANKVRVEMGYPRLRAPLFGAERVGKFVSVRPVGEEHEGKTLLGIYLGDLAPPAVGMIGDVLVVRESIGLMSGNPAIYVPSLGQLVYGFESWWSTIESEEQLREITDHDIDSAWYVRVLRSIEK
jgi:hypothetical protein